MDTTSNQPACNDNGSGTFAGKVSPSEGRLAALLTTTQNTAAEATGFTQAKASSMTTALLVTGLGSPIPHAAAAAASATTFPANHSQDIVNNVNASLSNNNTNSSNLNNNVADLNPPDPQKRLSSHRHHQTRGSAGRGASATDAMDEEMVQSRRAYSVLVPESQSPSSPITKNNSDADYYCYNVNSFNVTSPGRPPKVTAAADAQPQPMPRPMPLAIPSGKGLRSKSSSAAKSSGSCSPTGSSGAIRRSNSSRLTPGRSKTSASSMSAQHQHQMLEARNAALMDMSYTQFAVADDISGAAVAASRAGGAGVTCVSKWGVSFGDASDADDGEDEERDDAMGGMPHVMQDPENQPADHEAEVMMIDDDYPVQKEKDSNPKRSDFHSDTRNVRLEMRTGLKRGRRRRVHSDPEQYLDPEDLNRKQSRRRCLSRKSRSRRWSSPNLCPFGDFRKSFNFIAENNLEFVFKLRNYSNEAEGDGNLLTTGDMIPALSVPSVVAGSQTAVMFPSVSTSPRLKQFFVHQPTGHRLDQQFTKLQSLSSSSLPNIHIQLEDPLPPTRIPHRPHHMAQVDHHDHEQCDAERHVRTEVPYHQAFAASNLYSDASSGTQTLLVGQLSGTESSRPTIPPKPKYLQQSPKQVSSHRDTASCSSRRRRAADEMSPLPPLDSMGQTVSLSNHSNAPAAASEVNSILNEIELGLNSLLVGKVPSNTVTKRDSEDEGIDEKVDYVIR
jgi:hypothetical protein